MIGVIIVCLRFVTSFLGDDERWKRVSEISADGEINDRKRRGISLILCREDGCWVEVLRSII